ncbi:MAG: tetratricopeptide repeat protein, partial [Steroidobacteraceae bacterium]
MRVRALTGVRKLLRPAGAAVLAGIVAALGIAIPANAARHDPDKLAPVRVRDLNFGDVLFYYFQGPDKDLETITRIEAYEHWGLMPHHRAEADLLLGGLYLDLGLYNEAGTRFARLLTPDVPPGVRNRAWFYLAEVWYERGYLDRAQQALGRIEGRLPGQLEARRVHLLSNVLIRQGRDDAAVSLLEHWQGPPDWMAYARFNLGIALIREHRLAEADRYLGEVGTLETTDRELIALRDRANLAIGYAQLQAHDAARARPALERVRLDGPYSNRALLGMGWADAALGDYSGALVPWLELRRRSLVDAAVQESYLAVPYAYGKLGAEKEAAASYEHALSSYTAEDRALEGAIARVEHGDLLTPLLAESGRGNRGWYRRLATLPDSPESRYLYDILASDDFQAGLENYRELGTMQRTLTVWAGSMEAVGDMIDARERASAVRLPRTDRL